MRDYLKEFVDNKLKLAERLADGELGAWYGDAILIISSVISSFAADLWKGNGIDRSRFVELWVNHTPGMSDSILISLPLILEDLRVQKDFAAVRVLEQTNRQAFSGYPSLDSLVIKGTDVDLLETQVAKICPHLTRQFIRNHSYPAIFYREVRSAYVHEYQNGRFATSRGMVDDEFAVSYTNQTDPPYRTIYFPLPWLQKLTRTIHKSFQQVHKNAPFSNPSKWWIEG